MLKASAFNLSARDTTLSPLITGGSGTTIFSDSSSSSPPLWPPARLIAPPSWLPALPPVSADSVGSLSTGMALTITATAVLTGCRASGLPSADESGACHKLLPSCSCLQQRTCKRLTTSRRPTAVSNQHSFHLCLYCPCLCPCPSCRRHRRPQPHCERTGNYHHNCTCRQRTAGTLASQLEGLEERQEQQELLASSPLPSGP